MYNRHHNILIVSHIYYNLLLESPCKNTIIKRLLPAFITDFINIGGLIINSFFILQAKQFRNA